MPVGTIRKGRLMRRFLRDPPSGRQEGRETEGEVRFFDRLFMKPSRGVIQYDLWITAAISSSMAVFFLFFGYVEFTTDSNTYTHYAIEMVQGNFDPSLAIRPPGYPAMLVLTGYTISGSLIGVLILQAASGAAIPVITGM